MFKAWSSGAVEDARALAPDADGELNAYLNQDRDATSEQEDARTDGNEPSSPFSASGKGSKAKRRRHHRRDEEQPAAHCPDSAGPEEVGRNFDLDADAILILPELEQLMPPLSQQVLASLEQRLLEESQLSPAVVYRQGDRWALLDGHHRVQLLRKHGRAVRCVAVNIRSIDEARTWIVRHSVGRRNLAGPALWLTRGRMYIACQRKGKRTDLTSHTDCGTLTTADVAEAFGVSARTLEQDAAFVRAAEQLEADHGEWIISALRESGDVSKSAVTHLARVALERRVELLAQFGGDDADHGPEILSSLLGAATQEPELMDEEGRLQQTEAVAPVQEELATAQTSSQRTDLASTAMLEPSEDEDRTAPGDASAPPARAQGSADEMQRPNNSPAIFENAEDFRAASEALAEAQRCLEQLIAVFEQDPGPDTDPILPGLRDLNETVGGVRTLLDGELVPAAVCSACMGQGCADCGGKGWRASCE